VADGRAQEGRWVVRPTAGPPLLRRSVVVPRGSRPRRVLVPYQSRRFGGGLPGIRRGMVWKCGALKPPALGDVESEPWMETAVVFLGAYSRGSTLGRTQRPIGSGGWRLGRGRRDPSGVRCPSSGVARRESVTKTVKRFRTTQNGLSRALSRVWVWSICHTASSTCAAPTRRARQGRGGKGDGHCQAATVDYKA